MNVARDHSERWTLKWMTHNPVSSEAWNIYDEEVQKKILRILHKAKPEFVIAKGTTDRALNMFLSEVFKVQNQNQRLFTVSVPVQLTLETTHPVLFLKRLPGITQSIPNMDSGTERFITNSIAV